MAPDYRAALTGLGNCPTALARQWTEIETEFDSTPDWADGVMPKYYVPIGRRREPKLFGGEATCISVERGMRRLSAMFVHPNTAARYRQGNVEAVHVWKNP